MRMPGFSAEAALGRSAGSYRSVANRTKNTGDEGIVPQIQRKIFTSRDGQVLLDCYYTDRGEWLYCDVYKLPPV